jgi:pilus assembly protein CpaE
MYTDAITCGLKVWNDAVARQLEDAISSLPGFAVGKTAGAGPWDVVIVEIDGRGGDEFDFARDALRSGMAKNIFLTAPGIDADVLREALAISAKGFFGQPIDRDEVKAALSKVGDERHSPGPEKAPKKGMIIDVLGAKGGIGTTTVAVNIATSMLDLEGVESVALVDMSEPFGDVSLFLDMDRPADRIADWNDVSKKIGFLDAPSLMNMLPRHPSGLFVLPASESVLEDGRVPQVTERILGLMGDLFDYVIVDGGRSLGPGSRSVLKVADEVVLVTVLALPSLVNVRRLLETFGQLGYPAEERVHVVANRLVKKSDIRVKDAEATLKKKISWSIPNDYRGTMSAINQGKPLAGVDRGAEANARVRGLAALLAGRDEGKKKRRRGFFG